MSLEALAEVIATRVKGAKPAKPILRVIVSPKPTLFDSITRASILDRVRRLRDMYRLDWLIEQETFNKPGLESLEDAELSALLRDMERARECITEGTAFDDAGLVRNTCSALPDID
jgi:hypothetical protein